MTIKNIDFRLIFCILVVLFLPPFFYAVLGFSSYSIGLFSACLIVLALNIRILTTFHFKLTTFLLLIAVALFLFITSFYTYIYAWETKPIYSLLPLLEIIFAAFILAQRVKNSNYKTLENSLLVIIVILLLFGWLKLLFPITCCNYIKFNEPVFPFLEPSHFALGIGILAIAYSVVANKTWIIFLGINLLVFSLLFPSLLLLIIVFSMVFVSFLRIRRSYFLKTFLFIPVIVILTVLPLVLKNPYFSSRLNFQNTNNLTTLVYLQGWQLAYLNFLGTAGLGLGFQNLGSTGTYLGSFSDKIFKIMGGAHLNLMDGGFLAAKVIAEFGIIGVLIALFFCVYIVRFVFFANKTWNKMRLTENYKETQLMKKKLLLSGIVFSFFIEFFFRGLGYFSPELFLVIVALGSGASTIFRVKNISLDNFSRFVKK